MILKEMFRRSSRCVLTEDGTALRRGTRRAGCSKHVCCQCRGSHTYLLPERPYHAGKRCRRVDPLTIQEPGAVVKRAYSLT